jgi:tetratricopeptide (TPR) repeat protein
MKWSGATAAALTAVLSASWFALGQRVASLNNLSLDDLSRGAPAEAAARLEQAYRLCARFGLVLNGCLDVNLNLGRAYLDGGRFAEAREQLSRTVARAEGREHVSAGEEDQLATAYQNRAFVEVMLAEEAVDAAARLDGYARAQRDFETALGLYNRSPGGAAARPTSVTMARIHLGRGEYAQALAELERASRVSDMPDIDLLFAAAHRCVGNGLQSLEHFRRYIGSLPGRDQDPQWLRSRPYYERISTRCTLTQPASF